MVRALFIGDNMLNLIIQIEAELSPLAERMGALRRVRQVVEQHLDIVLSPSSYTEEELMTSCTLVENSIKDFNLSVEIIET